ncbi:hypothetical protein [Cupriavidus sp. D384]|uniref:hypothetical protein n=1 Tax=Cupriavidus sp. D384 TaxID=1538095 RepID=UPI000A5A7573|nr:hypothetical protein [Cupriavidus sp. D384]
MQITLYRSGAKAIFVTRERRLEDLPAAVLQWFGAIEREDHGVLTESTPMLGLSAVGVLADIAAQGYCAIDIPTIPHVYPEDS